MGAALRMGAARVRGYDPYLFHIVPVDLLAGHARDVPRAHGLLLLLLLRRCSHLGGRLPVLVVHGSVDRVAVVDAVGGVGDEAWG